MILPVLDLLGGKVVHGQAGQRSAYRALVPESRPTHVMRRLQKRYPSLFDAFYLADLDALQGDQTQLEPMRRLLNELPSVQMWVDAGFATASSLLRFIDALGSEFTARLIPIVASETLKSWEDLAAIVRRCGTRQVVFSLDLARGRIRGGSKELAKTARNEIIERVVGVGITCVVVLDVASVGIRQGVSTLELCRQIHEQQRSLRILTGGGVRTVDDLLRVRNAGCTGALVATALHDGTLTPAELTEFVGDS